MPKRKLLWTYGVSVAALLVILACGKTDRRAGVAHLAEFRWRIEGRRP